MNTKLIGDTIGGHVQRLFRQGLTAAAGFLAAKNLATVPDSSVDAISSNVGGIVSAIVVGVIAYGWSTFRAKILKES